MSYKDENDKLKQMREKDIPVGENYFILIVVF